MTKKMTFEQFNREVKAAEARNPHNKDLSMASQILSATASFLTNTGSVTGVPVGNTAALESFQSGVTPVYNSEVSFGQDISFEHLQDYLDQCGLDRTRSPSMHNNALKQVAYLFYRGGIDMNRHFSASKEGRSLIPTHRVTGTSAYGQVSTEAAAAVSMEAFGRDIDKVSSDFRLTLALTVMKAYNSLLDRVFERIMEEENIITVKIPEIEVYDLEKARGATAAVRNGNHRVPMIDLYRNPAPVDTTPKKVVTLAANDTGDVAMLLSGAPSKLKTGVTANLYDLAMDSSRPGHDQVDFTDLIAEGGSVSGVVIKVTNTTTSVAELFTVSTAGFRMARYTTVGNSMDSGDRAAMFQLPFVLKGDTDTDAGATTVNIAALTGAHVEGMIDFVSQLNLKTSDISGNGSATAVPVMDDGGAVDGTTQTAFNLLKFEVVGYVPELRYSEENMRKSTTALRMNWRSEQFEIPPGRNVFVDFAMDQDSPDEVLSAVANVNAIGNSYRGLMIMLSVMGDVAAANALEEAYPERFNAYEVAKQYPAGSLSLPYVIEDTLDLTMGDAAIAVMRESERMTELHAALRARLTGLIAELQHKSLYHTNLDPGETPVFKVIAWAPLIDLLFAIPDYHAALHDAPDGGREQAGSNYSMMLPNGVRIDAYKTDFADLENKILVVPVRANKADDVTSFGTVRDRGTFVGRWIPSESGSARHRVVTNSREILYTTNPLGAMITVTNLDAAYPNFA